MNGVWRVCDLCLRDLQLSVWIRGETLLERPGLVVTIFSSPVSICGVILKCLCKHKLYAVHKDTTTSTAGNLSDGVSCHNGTAIITGFLAKCTHYETQLMKRKNIFLKKLFFGQKKFYQIEFSKTTNKTLVTNCPDLTWEWPLSWEHSSSSV